MPASSITRPRFETGRIVGRYLKLTHSRGELIAALQHTRWCGERWRFGQDGTGDGDSATALNIAGLKYVDFAVTVQELNGIDMAAPGTQTL